MMERYTTKEEIDFIRGLGTHTLRGKAMGRKLLLHLYRQALSLRKNWEHLDKAIIMKFAEAQFDTEVNR